MQEKELIRQSLAIIEFQNSLLEIISTFRSAWVKAKTLYEKERELMTTLHRKKTMEFSYDEKITKAIDPRSGRANKEWTQFLIDEALEGDKEYIEQFAKVYEAQQEVFEAEAGQLLNAEKLGITKSQARLIAALMEYSSGERDS